MYYESVTSIDFRHTWGLGYVNFYELHFFFTSSVVSWLNVVHAGKFLFICTVWFVFSELSVMEQLKGSDARTTLYFNFY